MRILLLIIL